MKKFNRKAPIGYRKDTRGFLKEHTEEKELLLDMKELIETNQMSLRDAAFLLSHKTKKSISHEGLRKRLAAGIDYLDEEYINANESS